MRTEEWIEVCRERGRRGGLKSAHIRRQKRREDELKEEARLDEEARRAQFNQGYCPECGAELHMHYCEECGGDWK